MFFCIYLYVLSARNCGIRVEPLAELIRHPEKAGVLAQKSRRMAGSCWVSPVVRR
jgi:hypothetical protein